MPTGYTARVCDGTITEFPKFAMCCARAFGALVTLRDDPMDAAIPKRFEPDTRYHDECITAARATLDALKNATDDELRRGVADKHANAMDDWRKSVDRALAIRDRLQTMLREVQQWAIPSPGHQGLKDFMIQQLSETIKFDGEPYPAPKDSDGLLIEAQGVAAYRTSRIASLISDLEYHEAQRAKEIERTESRNRWIEQLRKSLGPSNVPNT